MSDITLKQNAENNLLLLRAFSVVYSKAKVIRSVRILISYTLVITAPFILCYRPALKVPFSILGSIWAIISYWISLREKHIITNAVKIQEEFDISVFGITWNSILAGDKVANENIADWASNFNPKKYDKINNWYGDLTGIPRHLGIAMCQKTNLIWDWKLRRKYFMLSAIIILVIYLTGLILSLTMKLSLADYLLLILLPSSSAYILGIRELKEHYDNYTAKSKLGAKVKALIDEQIKEKETVLNDTNIRQIQDQIFILRKCPALVPNWFNSIFKKKYDSTVGIVLNQYKNELSLGNV